MGTAIGDLVVSLGVENSQFVSALNTSSASLDEFSGHAEQAGEEAEHFNGEIEGLRGGARGLNELGRTASELGEKFGGANSAIGSTAESLGGLVGGVGHGAMVYHALQESIELTTGAQAVLNAISPLGWALLAAGAVAAVAAYVHFTSGAEEAAEAAKKLAEEQKHATDETNSALQSLQKEADKLNTAPLELFRRELIRTGESASTIASKLLEYQQATDSIASANAAKKLADSQNAIDSELNKKQRELDQSGMSEANKAVANLGPDAAKDQQDRAFGIGARQDMLKLEEKQQSEQKSERERALSQAKSLIESAQSPLDKLIESERKLLQDFRSGLIDRATADSAIQVLREKAFDLNSAETRETPGVGAALAGTAEGFSAVQAANRQSVADTQREQQIALLQKQLEQAAAQTALLQNVSDAVASPIQPVQSPMVATSDSSTTDF